MNGYLLDTNIFSEIFKANKSVTQQVGELGPDVFIDITVYIECLQGSKSNSEKRQIKRFLESFPLIPYNTDQSRLAVDLIDQYSNSHGLLLGDALISASALSFGLTIFTFNYVDFQFIQGLQCLCPESK